MVKNKRKAEFSVSEFHPTIVSISTFTKSYKHISPLSLFTTAIDQATHILTKEKSFQYLSDFWNVTIVTSY